MGTIIVGVDGSEGSKAALRWALREARLREATIEVVMTWHIPYVGGTSIVPLGTVTFDPVELEASHRALLEEIIREVKTDVGSEAEGLAIRPIVLLSSVPSALIEAAADADLLVVGSRGLGGFKGLVLGSVTHQVIGHAACPVVVVPPPSSDDGD